MTMRLRTCTGILAGALITAALSSFLANAQAPTVTPSPAPEGIVPAIVRGSSSAAAWLTGLAQEYAGSPLWSTISGIAIIVMIVSLIMWLRRPRKPLETESPA